MPTITSSYNIEKDVQNRRQAMNSFTNGRGYENMDNESQEIFQKITGIPFRESMEILIPFLEKRYNENREEIDNSAKEIKIKLDSQKNQIFELMEKLTKRPIFNENFQIRYTTCLRGPYTRKTGEIRMMEPSKKEFRLKYRTKSFVHELLHFQTHKYYENIPPMNQLDKGQFNLLKESLTFLLNHEFKTINIGTDQGYPQHQEFRKILEDYRVSCGDQKDFEDLINFGCKKILKQ